MASPLNHTSTPSSSPGSPTPPQTHPALLTGITVHTLKMSLECLTLKPTTFHDINTRQLLLAPFSQDNWNSESLGASGQGVKMPGPLRAHSACTGPPLPLPRAEALSTASAKPDINRNAPPRAWLSFRSVKCYVKNDPDFLDEQLKSINV